MALKADAIFKLSTPKKVLLLVALLGMIAGLYLHFSFSGRREEIKLLKADLDKLIKELNGNKTITRDLQKFKEQLAKMDEELARAVTQLPNEKEIPEILKNIASLGKESNLEFTLFRPKAEVPQQFYAKVPIELTALGSYHNTGIFFDRVSKLPRIINVIDFNMTRVKDAKAKAGGEILVRTSCLVNTYRFIEKKSVEKEKKIEQKKGEEKKHE
ncbi:MAG: type 4a pilus biogenesis protein PilO [Syntrophaceae bacterium]|nr:type 4a pilus biogenesis protein PilO [Syntrophaceae bacterium]